MPRRDKVLGGALFLALSRLQNEATTLMTHRRVWQCMNRVHTGDKKQINRSLLSANDKKQIP